MIRFLIVWTVFSVKSCLIPFKKGYENLSHYGISSFRFLLRRGYIVPVLLIAKLGCRIGVFGRKYRNQNKVATQNYRSLVETNGNVDARWAAIQRFILEEAATWGQNRQIMAQLQACILALDSVVAPLHQQNKPIVLAPLHMVSDVLATIVGSGVTPGNATVVVSSSAEQQKYNASARELGQVNLSYCSIHQDNKSLATQLMTLMTETATGQKNMIVFPDITPDYTIQTEEGMSSKLSCQLFGRAAKLHNGVVRLSNAISAQVVFYHLYYQNGLKIKIYPPIAAKDVAAQMPVIIENSIREYPNDWLLWHSHSLYFISH
ncbi:ABC transporter [Providencia sp. PROV259]|uniref:ABC transporter n=1 Tax=Providencia sp. PROV259 TaxID=2949947 RepID=UPI002349A23A|nr:ABC transporter [Providencia sp. PROV259]